MRVHSNNPADAQENTRRNHRRSMQNVPVCILVVSDQDIPRSGTSIESIHETRIFLSQYEGAPPGSFRLLRTDATIHYEALCDDFGPMNVLSIFQFIEALDQEIDTCKSQGIAQLVYCAGDGVRALTNAAFLLGTYMVLKCGMKPDEVNARFQSATPLTFEGYRDATFTTPDFRLHLIDCWRGLHRGMTIGWVAMPSASDSSDWGRIDKDAYAHYDNPLNADLHEVVPGKFVAFRGPRHLGGPTFVNNYERNSREFDPKHYLDIFEDLKVSTIIRLNEATYDGRVFDERGFQLHDLYFDDCTPPPPAIVKRFCDIADGAAGTVAIHCKAGLGRTGTLIALYMMRTHGFSAREAMGWLRIMRPGSVIGRQQHFLCMVDQAMRNKRLGMVQLPDGPAPADSPEGHSPESPAAGAAEPVATPASADGRRAADVAAEQAEQVSEGMHRRDKARHDWAASVRSASLKDLGAADTSLALTPMQGATPAAACPPAGRRASCPSHSELTDNCDHTL